MASKAVGHVTYPYPNSTQGLDSASHIGKMLLGIEPKVKEELINHIYTALGYGLSIYAPVSPAPVFEGKDVAATIEECKAFFGGVKGDGEVGAIDWQKALALLIQLLTILPELFK